MSRSNRYPDFSSIRRKSRNRLPGDVVGPNEQGVESWSTEYKRQSGFFQRIIYGKNPEVCARPRISLDKECRSRKRFLHGFGQIPPP
jgi:hypothetical protein